MHLTPQATARYTDAFSTPPLTLTRLERHLWDGISAERIRSASAQIVNSQVWTMKRQVLTKSVYYRSLINLPHVPGKPNHVS